MKKILVIGSLLFSLVYAYPEGLEGIIVEKYYVTAEKDSVIVGLPEGAVTYRIYADLEKGFRLQGFMGYKNHKLIIGTTTGFYNCPEGGSKGVEIRYSGMNNNDGLALDSWITIGAATDTHIGVLKNEDNDGSVLIREGLNETDGLVESKVPDFFTYECNMEAFTCGGSDSLFIEDDMFFAVLKGYTGPTDENKILIAQVTTDGELFFELNLQILGPGCGEVYKYVAKNPEEDFILSEELTYGKYQ